MVQRGVIALALAACCAPAHVLAAPVLDLEQQRGPVDLLPYLELLQDHDGTFTVQQVAAPPLSGQFAPATGDVLKPRGDAVVWVRFSYRAPRVTDLRLALAHVSLARLQAYLPAPDGGWTERRFGAERVSSPSTPVLWRLLPTGDQPRTVLMRVVNRYPVLLDLTVCRLTECRAQDARRNVWYGLFYGVMLVMALFSLGLFVALRDRTHLLYVGFVGAVVLYFLGENGLLSFLVPSIGLMGLFDVNGLAISLIVIFSGTFTRAFLETKRIAPLADRVVLAYVVLGLGFAVGLLFVPWRLLGFYANFLGISAPFVIIGAGVVALRRGFRPAASYLVAWTAIGVGAFVVATPPHAAWRVDFFQVCAALNALLLSLALAHRMRTLRAEREDALREAQQREQLVRAVFDQTFQFIGLTAADGTILEINRTALAFGGADASEVLGRAFWETPFWPEGAEDAARLKAGFADAAAGRFVRFETRAQRPDGGTPWLDVSIKPIRDDAGQVTQLIVEARDISARMRSELELRQTHEQLEATLSALPDLFFEVDRAGRIHDFRAPQPGLLAMAPEQFLGRRVDELMPGEVTRSIMDALAAAEQSESKTHVGETYRLETPQGPGWFEPSVAVKGDPQDEGAHFVVLVRDVTDRTRAERELRRRGNMLRALHVIGRELFAARRLEAIICHNLEELGPAAEVSRIAVYANVDGEGGVLRAVRRFEWTAPGVEARGTGRDLAAVDYADTGLGRWVALLERGEPIVGNAASFPEAERLALQRLGTRSLAVVPIMTGGAWWGFIAFEEHEGEHQWTEPELTVLRGAAGLLGVAIERERAEEALRESEAKHRAIFENAQVALFRIRVSDGKVLEANAVMAEMFGYGSREEYIEHYSMATGWVEPDDRRRMLEQFENNGGQLDRFEAKFRRKDGTVFWARFSARLFSERGYMEGVGQDVTEEKRWVQELAESESRYRTIFETTGHAMVIFDDDGLIELANREFAKLTGYGAEQVREGLTWMKLFTGQTLERMRHYHQQRSKSPDAAPRSYEATLVDSRGREHEGIVVIEMIPGTTKRVAGFVDLTERRHAEQQMLRADKMAALGQIIAGVAHEINNPNNFIYFNLPILKRYIEAMRPMLDHHAEEDPGLKVLNMPYREFLDDVSRLVENMQHGSERITGIVSELKNYIRGHEIEERRPEQLTTVFDHVMVLVGKQVQKMVKRFEVQVEEGLPPVNINAGKIEQVLINLIINAGQAADKAESWVRLHARGVEDGRAVEILVEDNGTGISAELQQQIFDPFFTTKGRESGTGLGLSISSRIVEEHGGRITVQSTPGEGTRFAIRLPACDGPPQEESAG